MTSHRHAVELAAEQRRALLQRAQDDPDYAKNRTRIAALIRRQMDLPLTAAGFQAEGRTRWLRRGFWFDLSVDLQRGKYGTDAWINLTATPRRFPGRPVQRRLGAFYPDPPYPEEPGQLTYQALIEDPGLLAQPMQIFETRALPWLLGMGRLIPRNLPVS